MLYILTVQTEQNVVQGGEIMKEYNIQELRVKNNLTQYQVAKETGVTKNYISMIERGIRNPSDKMKERLAKLYNTTVVQIFLAYDRTKCCARQK